MMSLIMNKLSIEYYKTFLTSYQIHGYTGTNFANFQNCLREYWETNLKTKSENSFALTVTVQVNELLNEAEKKEVSELKKLNPISVNNAYCFL